MEDLINKEYLKNFWSRVKYIPENSKYILDNKSQTIKDAINSNSLSIHELTQTLSEINEKIDSLKRALSINSLSASGPVIIEKSGNYTYKRTIRPVNGVTDLKWIIVNSSGEPLDTGGLVSIKTDEDSLDDNGILTVQHGYKGIIRIQAYDKISELKSEPIAVDIDTTIPDPIWIFENSATSNLQTTTISSDYNIGSANGLSEWLVCVRMTKTSGTTTNIGLAAGSASYNNSTGFTMLSRNRATQFDIRVFGKSVATQQSSYTIYVMKSGGTIQYSTNGTTWNTIANPSYANGNDGILRYIGNSAVNYNIKVELYTDLSGNDRVIERFNKD